MTTRDYDLRAYPSQRLLVITFASGCWDATTTIRFGNDCIKAIKSLGCPRGRHLVLVDLRNAVLQTREEFARMQALMTASVAEKTALVAQSPLSRMQTKRLQVRSNVILFDTMAQAWAWLLEGQSSWGDGAPHQERASAASAR